MRRTLLALVAVAMVSAAEASAAVTEYPVPTANGGPIDIAAGSDGALWFTEILGGKIGRIETDGDFTEHPLPNAGSWPTAITAGPDGALWFGENRGGNIGRITTTGEVTEYPLSPAGEYEPGIATSGVADIAAGPDGALWFTQFERVHGDEGDPLLPNRIGRITTAGAITYYELPRVASTIPTGITAGPDGAMWFAECGGFDPETGDPFPSQIGRITTTGVITEYPITTPFACATDITPGPDGALWFTEPGGASKIGRITTAGAITEFENPAVSGFQQIITGPDGALWFTLPSGGLGSVTTSGEFERYAVPSEGNTNGITIGPDGLIWFTEPTQNRIGRVDEPEPFLPQVTVGGSEVTEGTGATSVAEIPVSLNAPSPHTVTVDYETSNGTAVAPGDYDGTSGTLTFPPGETSGVISVNVTGDALDEDDEEFNVTLSDPQQATILNGEATAGILDDDPPPTISVADSPDRSEGGGAHRFAVTLSEVSGRQVTVDYATANGNAVAPGDYTATSGTLTFAPGDITKTVTVSSAADALDEDDESFALGLSNPVGATVADASGSGTILDNDPPSALSVTDSPNRSEGGPASTFVVTLSPASGRTVTVGYATQNGAAKAPGDYASVAGTLTFLPGQTTKTVSVSSVEDALDEANEDLVLKLAAPAAATLADPSAAGLILDDDPTPSLSISDAVNRVEGGAAHKFTITLSASSGRQVSVNYATVRGTALGTRDFVPASGTLTFAPGQRTKTVSVANVNDSVDEPNETFTVRLSGPVAAAIADSSGATTILDND